MEAIECKAAEVGSVFETRSLEGQPRAVALYERHGLAVRATVEDPQTGRLQELVMEKLLPPP